MQLSGECMEVKLIVSYGQTPKRLMQGRNTSPAIYNNHFTQTSSSMVCLFGSYNCTFAQILRTPNQ